MIGIKQAAWLFLSLQVEESVMESILSDVPAIPRNAPRDLLSRLYREIGISAVAAALEITDVALVAQPSTPETSESPARQAA